MGRGEQRSPVLFAISLAISAQYLCFFTYHVGDGAPDVPFGERRGLNLYIPCRRTKAGERCSPLRQNFYCRKIAALFADFTLYKEIVKRCSFVLRYSLCLRRRFVFLLFLSAPLGRLAPIEALPISCERSRTRNLLRRGFAP